MKYLLVAFIVVANAALCQNQVVLGTGGSSTSQPFPMAGDYNAISMIYSKSQIGTAGTITKIGWFATKNQSGTPNGYSMPVYVYMREDVDSVQTGTTFGGNIVNARRVYTGSISNPTGAPINWANTWYEVTLDTPFYYSNSKHLNVTVECDRYFPFWNALFACNYTSAPSYKPSQAWGGGPSSFNNISSGSNMYLNARLTITTALPTTLQNFNGNRQGAINRLTWSTLVEQNNAGFNIQKSMDGINFSNIGFASSKGVNGNSNSLLTYYFNDSLHTDSNNNYYRIQQIDKNGHSSNSVTLLIKPKQTGETQIEQIYPNPLRGDSKLNIIINSKGKEKLQFAIYNIQGQKVQENFSAIDIGTNHIFIGTNRLTKGIYYLKVFDEANKVIGTQKFIRQ